MSFPVLMPLSTVAPAIAHRIGYRRTVVTGMLLVAAGMALLAALADVDRGYLSVVPGLVVLAVGVGVAISPSTTAITASLPVEKQGVVSALNHTAREMGAALGIALVGSILNAQYRANISDAAAALPPELAQPVRAGIGGAGEAIRWCPARDRSPSATMGATSPSSTLAARASTWCCSIPTGSARACSIPSPVAAVFAPVLLLSCVGGGWHLVRGAVVIGRSI